MEQAVRHCRIQQRGNDAAVEEAIISLEFGGHFESRSDAAVS